MEEDKDIIESASSSAADDAKRSPGADTADDKSALTDAAVNASTADDRGSNNPGPDDSPSGDPPSDTAEPDVSGHADKRPQQASADPATASGADKPRARRARFGRIVAIIIVLLLLAALALGGWFGWQWWQQQQGRAQAVAQTDSATQQALRDLGARSDKLAARLDAQQRSVDALGDKLASQQGREGKMSTALNAHMQRLQSANTALHQRLAGLQQRTAALESSFAKLGQVRTSGADRMRLDDVELLLTLAGQRYKLLHDDIGALKALRTASAVLAEVDDPAFAGVARTLEDEISALAATRPQQRQARLLELQSLRQQWATLPPKSLDEPAPENPDGAWARVKDALSGLVVVHNDASVDRLDKADARLARQLARIDLAQAQAALLSRQPQRALAALKRVGASLPGAYDADSQAVRQAQARLDHLIASLQQIGKVDVQLGAALTALGNQRQVRRMGAGAAKAADAP